jgi:hypothetical protein
MCGKTIIDDGIKLHVDHRVPQHWGGTSDPSNLWAICSACNEGKKSHFATFSAELMQQLANLTVHDRLATLLNLKPGEWLSSDLLSSMANLREHQDDWQKRLRELRSVGIHFETRKVHAGRRVISEYRFPAPTKLPKDITELVRIAERQRRLRKQADSL